MLIHAAQFNFVRYRATSFIAPNNAKRGLDRSRGMEGITANGTPDPLPKVALQLQTAIRQNELLQATELVGKWFDLLKVSSSAMF